MTFCILVDISECVVRLHFSFWLVARDFEAYLWLALFRTVSLIGFEREERSTYLVAVDNGDTKALINTSLRNSISTIPTE